MGRRAGAITVSLDIWHLDILDFLDIQTEHGEQRHKAHEVFPQIVILDEFMRRVELGQDWLMVDPFEVKEVFHIELDKLYGDEFTKAYKMIESQQEILTLTKTINAKELFKEIMRRQIETGMPYLTFKDTINRVNPNKHIGIIPCSNLCVAPETKILTDKGHLPIIEMVGQTVNLWNGKEWSETLIRKTGVDQPLLKVEFSNGETLDCTYYHRFAVQQGYKSGAKIVQAQDLKVGDTLIKYDLPVISNESDIEFPYAYTHGAFCGDGSYSSVNLPEIDLYGQKKNLLSHLEIRNKIHQAGSCRKDTGVLAVYDDVKQDRLVCKLPTDLAPKFTVPINGYTIESRLAWLAGLLDTDGCVVRNGSNESFQITSVNKKFLLDIKLMLQTLGSDSKVIDLYPERLVSMPDGKGGKKEYNCQRTYRLVINSNDLYTLANLGLKTNRLTWAKRLPQRKASQFIRVAGIIHTGRISDTYCFTEPKRNMGMFNGVLAMNCVESYSNVEPGETIHTCNLISINFAAIAQAPDQIAAVKQATKVAVEILDTSMEIGCSSLPESQRHNNKYRTIGVGIVGLADWFAYHKLNYGTVTPELHQLITAFSNNCVRTSVNLAKIRGAYPEFRGSLWDISCLVDLLDEQEYQQTAYAQLPIQLTDIDLLKDLAKYGIRNSQLMAIAPNSSTSLVQGCTASYLPVFKKFFVNKGSTVSLIAPPFVKTSQWYYQENQSLWQDTVVKFTAYLQQYIDTGISMELCFNLNEGVYSETNGEAIKASDIYNTLFLAWKSGCKTVYYVRTIQKELTDTPQRECLACAS